jgi:hypothetical protein
MQDFITYAKTHGIQLLSEGPCQFCGSRVSKGVVECHGNAYHVSEVLDFNNPDHFETRFLSVDAMALQHCELHGKWNNHIHLTRLFLILQNNVSWDYSKTPQLSNIINKYKKDRSDFLFPPPPKQRGNFTTSDLIKIDESVELIAKVKEWAMEVFQAFGNHHIVVSTIASMYLDKYNL